MRVARGKVVGNTVVLDVDPTSASLPQNAAVTVYLDEEGWELSDAEWRELDEARAAVKRGEFVTDDCAAPLP